MFLLFSFPTLAIEIDVHEDVLDLFSTMFLKQLPTKYVFPACSFRVLKGSLQERLVPACHLGDHRAPAALALCHLGRRPGYRHSAKLDIGAIAVSGPPYTF